jgi:hypothetical protein
MPIAGSSARGHPYHPDGIWRRTLVAFFLNHNVHGQAYKVGKIGCHSAQQAPIHSLDIRFAQITRADRKSFFFLDKECLQQCLILVATNRTPDGIIPAFGAAKRTVLLQALGGIVQQSGPGTAYGTPSLFPEAIIPR